MFERCEEKKKALKLNNEGFTLIELLVALAVSGVVILMISILMSNGSSMFKSERSKIELQNELQAVDGFLTEVLMEAKTLDIDTTDSDLNTIYTGKRGASKELLSIDGNSISTERIISFAPGTNSLYTSKSYVENLTKGYLISGFVSEFSVSIDNSCKVYGEEETTKKGYVPFQPPTTPSVNPSESVTEEETTKPDLLFKGYKNPIIINVKITIEDENGKTKTDTKSYRLRNDISSVTIDGVTYNVK